MKNTPADQRAPRRLLLLPGPSTSSSHHHHHPPAHSSKHLELTEMLKRKLRLGAKMIKVGGVERMFRRVFKNAREGERLMRASQCYLWTTTGPIAGLLFISTEKVAFCSDRPIKLSSPGGEILRSHYKVCIPLGKVSRAVQMVENGVNRQSEKYLKVVTSDEFEFWFQGFVAFNKTFKCLHQAISHS